MDFQEYMQTNQYRYSNFKPYFYYTIHISEKYDRKYNFRFLFSAQYINTTTISKLDFRNVEDRKFDTTRMRNSKHIIWSA